MADYCKQCSEFYWGPQFENDAKGLSTPEDTEKMIFAAFLCEGCGETLVDHNGACVYCPKNGYQGRYTPKIHDTARTFGEK